MNYEFLLLLELRNLLAVFSLFEGNQHYDTFFQSFVVFSNPCLKWKQWLVQFRDDCFTFKVLIPISHSKLLLFHSLS